jgi:hypothetical protein
VTVVRQTWWLLGAVLLLGAMDLGVHAWRWWSQPAPIAPLPSFDPADAARITITSTAQTLTLERDGDRWRIAAPVEAPADRIEVETLLADLSTGRRPDARIPDADRETYGLDGGEEVAVEVAAHDGVLLSLVVGEDAGGESTWVRIPGDDDVLRAPIGGRARLSRPAGAWRDRTVTDLDPALVQGVVIQWDDRNVRTARTADGWSGDVDAPTIDRVVALAAGLRAEEVMAGERDNERRILLALEGPQPVSLELGRSGGLWTVRREGDPTVWRIDGALPALLSDPEALASRTLWKEDPEAVRRVTLERDGGTVEIVRAGASFRAVRPAHLELDPQRVGALVAFLAAPRVDAWMAVDAGRPRRTWRVDLGDRTRVLELGPDADQVWVRDAADPTRIGVLPVGTVRRIEAVVGG